MRTHARAGPARARGQNGFVLALTIVVLAAVAIAAAFIAERMRVALDLARADRDATEFALAAQNLRAELIIRMATEPRVVNSLGAVKLDGRAYRIAEQSWVSLTDARGLLNLNGADPATVQRFAAAFASTPAQAAALADVLLDFQDDDNLRRLNGAEADDYTRLGLAPPRNGPFVSPTELRFLPAWRDAGDLWDGGVADAIGLHAVTQVNPETAPETVLRALPGLDPQTAARLIQQRNDGRRIAPMVLQLTSNAGASGLYSPVIGTPSDTLVVTHWADRPGWGLRYAVTHTPNSDYGPWRIDYLYRISRPRATASDVALPPSLAGGDRPPPAMVLPGGGN